MDEKLQGIVNQLSYKKPPPPPIKMQVEEYIELLNRIKDSDPQLQEEALNALNQYNLDLEELTEKLADRLRVIYNMSKPLK
jgi:hypothetical protein